MDLQQGTLDTETGVVSGDFLNNNPLDHHFDPGKIAHLFTVKLNDIGLVERLF
ncbi:hypothetical protein SCD_n02397 [Sulfuricella denitrificans skB26]|uniref:Uncharacterized protein n=1 Tax=Sulfuricella denitrificans (strain DSM 22764 / NBRC 105220 / skB26) TaxID=1163617 RepID=S6AAS7_SULDS|nr:hypothetical protein SCD_n02397 [Sulfuricella denitrificans skB26]